MTVSFKNCKFTNGSSLHFEFIENVSVRNCLFHNNDAYFTLISIINVLNVEIYGCEFFQNAYTDNCVFTGIDLDDNELFLSNVIPCYMVSVYNRECVNILEKHNNYKVYTLATHISWKVTVV